ncbi:aminotransferase class I/II-fold pyridoxal phosphate-dependent enzyme [Alphaproteobacteria bacterium]|nr:aminotransferase class I/II-fold pyridoxal phosphate-dependent enzyme [Alphaproteobacteria bacterium]
MNYEPLNIERIRIPRGYNKDTLRLDMAERGSFFDDGLWTNFKDNHLKQLDILAYPDYGVVSAFEDRVKQHFAIYDFPVIVDCGSDALIKLAIEALSVDGDTIAAITPSFPMYGVYSKLQRRNFREFGGDANYTLSHGYLTLNIEYLLDSIDATAPKILFLSNPSSPFGAYYTSTQITMIAEQLNKYSGVLVLDEAYIEFCTACNQPQFNLSKYEGNNVIILRTMSKAIGVAGLRVGYAFGPQKLIDTLRMHQLTFPISGPAISFTQFLFENYSEVTSYIHSTIESREYILQTFEKNGLGYINSHTNSIHFSISPEKRAIFDEQNRKYDVLIKGANAATPIQIPNSENQSWIRMSLFAGMQQTNWFKSVFEEIGGK